MSRLHANQYEEKTKLAHNMYKIMQDELGDLIQTLDQKCPHAIEKRAGKDDVCIGT